MLSSNSEGTVRAFVAIELNARVREALAQAAADVRRVADMRVRWVKPEAIHLTLAFLGEIAGERVAVAAQAMEAAARLSGPFAMELGAVGGFPSLQHPRVLWVGITGGDALVALQLDMALHLRSEGFVLEDREFSPHLTLGRVVDGGRAVAVALARTPPASPHAGQMARRVTLYQSDLRPDGAVYTALAVAVLGESLSPPRDAVP